MIAAADESAVGVVEFGDLGVDAGLVRRPEDSNGMGRSLDGALVGRLDALFDDGDSLRQIAHGFDAEDWDAIADPAALVNLAARGASESDYGEDALIANLLADRLVDMLAGKEAVMAN